MTAFIPQFPSPSSPPPPPPLPPSTAPCPPLPSRSSTAATSLTTRPQSSPLSPIPTTMTTTCTTSTFMRPSSPAPSPTASMYYLSTNPLCIIAPFLNAAPSRTPSPHIPIPRTPTSRIPTCTLLSTTTPALPLSTTAHTSLRSSCSTPRTLPPAALPRFTTLAFTRHSLLHISRLCTTSPVHRIGHHLPLPCPRPLPSNRDLRIPCYRPSYSPILQSSAGLTSRRVSRIFSDFATYLRSRTVPRLNAQSPAPPPKLTRVQPPFFAISLARQNGTPSVPGCSSGVWAQSSQKSASGAKIPVTTPVPRLVPPQSIFS